MKKNPVEIALDLSKKIACKGYIKEVHAIGPYVNFVVNKQRVAKEIVEQILEEGPDFGKGKKDEKIMVEFMSPNTNKSLHLGHVRNGVLGEAVSSMLRFSGYDVVKSCLNNDRGTGVAEAMLGYEKFFSGRIPSGKSDKFVSECYVAFKKALKEDESLAKDVQEMVLK